MGALSSQQFGPDVPMFDVRPAEPHEQTHDQFLNRPDVFTHGRIVNRDVPLSATPRLDPDDPQGFHAGTREAAVDRLLQVGTPYAGNAKQHGRFFAGQVTNRFMQNRPPEEGPHHHPGQVVETRKFGGMEQHDVVRDADNEWRHKDQGDSWYPEHHDAYYRNDSEGVGSTSVILSPQSMGTNFRTHRGLITQALAQGKNVPAHVTAAYEASGGAGGSKAHFDAAYETAKEVHLTRAPNHPTLPYDASLLARQYLRA